MGLNILIYMYDKSVCVRERTGGGYRRTCVWGIEDIVCSVQRSWETGKVVEFKMKMSRPGEVRDLFFFFFFFFFLVCHKSLRSEKNMYSNFYSNSRNRLHPLRKVYFMKIQNVHNLHATLLSARGNFCRGIIEFEHGKTWNGRGSCFCCFL